MSLHTWSHVGKSIKRECLSHDHLTTAFHTGSGSWRLQPLWNGWNGFVWRIRSRAACRGGSSERVFPHRLRIVAIAAVVEWVEEGSEVECREKGLRTGSHISWYRRCRRNASFVGPFSAAFMTDRLSVQRHARDL